MDLTTFFIAKESGTSADTLLAVGFGSLLVDCCRWQSNSQNKVMLYDKGTCHVITIPEPIDLEYIEDADLESLQIVLPLVSQRQREKMAKKGETGFLDGFDYDQWREDSRAYREQLKKLEPALQTPEARLRRAPELQLLNEPDERGSHYLAISHMRITDTFNELALRWERLSPFLKRLHIHFLLDTFAQQEQDVDEIIVRWKQLAKEHGIKEKPVATALQIVNPTTGKGANRAKSGELTIGNQDGFWLFELFKFRGYMECAAPLLVQESDDRKLCVLQPRQIKMTYLQDMMKRFRTVLWSTTAIKLDILASLRFAQVFVQQYRELFQPKEFDNLPLPPSLVSLAGGFDVTFYKYLGSAHATMNIATIGFPRWLPPLEGLQAVEAAETLLAEHVRIIREIRHPSYPKKEEGAEEYELLRLYRDFLSGNDPLLFWRFAATYSGYVLKQWEQEKNPKRHIQQLHFDGMESIIMATQPKLTEITRNGSFRRIAAAIRNATVNPQRRKSKGQDSVYEIRYGLGQELLQKARHRQDFMIALGQFVHHYMAENGREMERAAKTKEQKPQYVRPGVSYDDIDAISDLIDTFQSSELIGTMLVACGYAAAPAKQSQEQGSQESSESVQNQSQDDNEAIEE